MSKYSSSTIQHSLMLTIVGLILTLMACNQPSSTSDEFTGVVSAASPEASLTGFDILKKGGNAIDATVAISFVLGVTEPAMSGLGGGMQILLSLPGERPVAINGATYSPADTPTDVKKIDLTYHRRSTIPSTVKVLHYIWKHYGSGQLSWAELIKPSIRYAADGFVVGKFRHKVYSKYEKELKNSAHHLTSLLLPDGNIPEVGDRIKQPVLAQTLKILAEHGPSSFYSGKIAQSIDRDMKENGGWISLSDLKAVTDPSELEPVHTTFRGYDIYSQPPPCGGWTALLALNLMELHPKEEMQDGSETRFANVLNALHLAHLERTSDPLDDLNNYHQAVSAKLDKAYAESLLKEYEASGGITKNMRKELDGETTHFSVVDKNGVAVAATASINAYFGAKAASSELGFLYNTYMDDFELDAPGHPFAIGPGKMNYSSMSPTIVQKNGETVLVIGSPGSARIISSVAQLVQLWIDSDEGIEKIIGYPRLHTANGKLYCESTLVPKEWLRELVDHNFELANPSKDLMKNGLNAYFGGVHAITKENGHWIGAADPRRDGKVAGNISRR